MTEKSFWLMFLPLRMPLVEICFMVFENSGMQKATLPEYLQKYRVLKRIILTQNFCA